MKTGYSERSLPGGKERILSIEDDIIHIKEIGSGKPALRARRARIEGATAITPSIGVDIVTTAPIVCEAEVDITTAPVGSVFLFRGLIRPVSRLVSVIDGERKVVSADGRAIEPRLTKLYAADYEPIFIPGGTIR